MKKTPRRLTLRADTIRSMQSSELRRANGGASNEDTCNICAPGSIFACQTDGCGGGGGYTVNSCPPQCPILTSA
jgi:hypothetical protein